MQKLNMKILLKYFLKKKEYLILLLLFQSLFTGISSEESERQSGTLLNIAK